MIILLRVYLNLKQRAKVFTDTWVPKWIQESVNMDTGEANLPENIHVGGTGFFFANAPNLDDEVEHHMPDYNLYNDWIDNEVRKAEQAAGEAGKKFNKRTFMVQFKEYTDYSIGFMTRGCFRKCPFSMIWKRNTFGKIIIGDSYDISVYNKEGALMTGSLSATEQMALAYAFTLAIHQASGKNCPLVIDSPLGRVSDDNRENMAKALLEVSKEKQIIMLFTPDEYSDSVKNKYESIANMRELKLSADKKYVEGIES